MIIKGGSCGGAFRLSAHLTRTDPNERSEVKELCGTAGETLHAALIDMTAFAAGTNCSKPLYHASINPEPGEKMTEAQWMRAVERLESTLGLNGQPRVVVEHVKDGRPHRHVVWSRIDLARNRAISDSHNFRKHEECSRALEREFGHAPVQGAHVERNGRKRPDRTPSHDEMQQAARTGIDPCQAREQITGLWRSTVTGQEFAAALDQAGWILARGDRRGHVVIDPAGGVHSLARRVDGVTAKDIRTRLADIDPARLPSVAEARTIQRDRQTTRAGEPQTATVMRFPRGITRQARQRERERPQRLAA